MCRPPLSAARRPHRDDGSPLLVPALIAARLLRSSSDRAHRQENPAQARALQRRMQHPPLATAARSNRARFGTARRTNDQFSRLTIRHDQRRPLDSTPVPSKSVRVSTGVSSACGGRAPSATSPSPAGTGHHPLTRQLRPPLQPPRQLPPLPQQLVQPDPIARPSGRPRKPLPIGLQHRRPATCCISSAAWSRSGSPHTWPSAHEVGQGGPCRNRCCRRRRWRSHPRPAAGLPPCRDRSLPIGAGRSPLMDSRIWRLTR